MHLLYLRLLFFLYLAMIQYMPMHAYAIDIDQCATRIGQSLPSPQSSPRLSEMIRIVEDRDDTKLQDAPGKCFSKLVWGFSGPMVITDKDFTPDDQDILYIEYDDIEKNPAVDQLLLSGKLDEAAIISGVRSGAIKVENVPGGAFLKFMYNKGFLSDVIRSIVSQKIFTKIYGYLKSDDTCEEDILDFIINILKLEVNSSTILEINREFKLFYGKGIDEYKTINEIFARIYTSEIVKSMLTFYGAKEGDIISSSTSRIRFYEKISDIDKNFHLTDKNISGKINAFNVRQLFGSSKENKLQAMPLKSYEDYERVLLHQMAEEVKGTTMIINRLAPVDYHNFHFPFSKGKVLSHAEIAAKLNNKSAQDFFSKEKHSPAAFHIDGEYLSVSTVATSSQAIKYNPLVVNIRDILFLEVPKLGVIPFVVVGATGVASNIITVTPGQELSMGDVMGHFEFGGSTVIMFLPENKIVAYPKIEKIKRLSYRVPSADQETTKEREMEIYMHMGIPLFYLKR
ncbi:MAG: phosphatidylserine decarboxylase [Oligoflexia bacterium]|nr:phosphatidylserine decarboxylase [Oligoflexia bacterium]